jgi:transposase InsO family protein
LVPIVTERAWERVQIDLIDMRHEPSGQFKWILHVKDHFSKYTQLYPLKSKHAEPIADAFALFIAAFLPPKIVQCDNGKEFKGALLILLRKYGIQVINGAPRSPQTQGLVEQANGVVEAKQRAWKMDHGSTEWADGLLEVTLAINTQKHSTIGCASAELLFRERTSYILSWAVDLSGMGGFN